MDEEKITEQTAEPEEAVQTEEKTPEEKPEPQKEKHKSKKDRLGQELESLRKELADEKDAKLRLAAEYDNYRKRSMKEKDHIYQDGVADTLAKFLQVYDNLERALQQKTEDEAYKKGVEMIMASMKDTLTKCGVEIFGEKGETFDPTIHNAVMHTEDESCGENEITEVFQKGIRIGEKIVRFAMVRVAN